MRFEVTLSDVDRGVYDTLELRVAQHPSETAAYLVTRVIAYALEFVDGLAFSRGLSVPDEPAVWAHDLTGVLTHWIEVGNPKPERLHRAAKAAPYVRIYTYKDPEVLRRSLEGKTIHRAEEIGLVALPADFLESLIATLGRSNEWTLSRSDGDLYVSVGELSLSCSVAATPLADS